MSRDKQFFKCFGCGEGGNVLSFVMKMDNLPFVEAVERLADQVGMQMPEAHEQDAQERRARARLLALNKEAAHYFHDTLLAEQGAAARAYLQRRGVSGKMVTAFGLGYAPEGWDGLRSAMRQKGFTERELEEAKLVGRSQKGSVYDFFRGRLMFPVIDIRGQVLAFGGRVLQGDGDGRKYINSGDTPVYHKSRVLYGMHLAKKSKAPYFLLCEGNLDVIALHQAGFDSAVASCGTAFTLEQARLMARYTGEVIICYDADRAGRAATDKAIDILKRVGLRVRVLQLPQRRDPQTGQLEKTDPDDFLKKHGAEAFAALLQDKQTDGQYRLGEMQGRYNLEQEEQRIAFLKEATQYIASLPSAVEREIFCRHAATAAGVSHESMMTEVARRRTAQGRKQKKQVERQALQPKTMAQPTARKLHYDDPVSALSEEKLLVLVLGDGGLLHEAAQKIAPDVFSSPFLGKLYSMALARLEQGLEATPAALMGALDEEELRHFTTLLSGAVTGADPQRELAEYIDIISYQHTKRKSDDTDLLQEALRRKQRREDKGI